MRGPKLAAVLGVAFIAVGIQNYVFFSSAPGPPVRIHGEEPDDPSEADGALSSGVGELDAVALEAWFSSHGGPERNPFLTAAEAFDEHDLAPVGDDDPVLRLTATLWSPDRRVAWINGRPHSEGDWIAGSQILRIESRTVVLNRGCRQFPLTIRPEAIAAFLPEPETDAY